MASRTQLLTQSNLRVDSRLPLELRSLSFQILPSPPSTSTSPSAPPAGADGYALVSHGLTRVSASVFGPREGMRSGAFSGAGGGGGARPGDKATVNVEVGVAGWSERNAAGTAGGVRKGGKDRRTIELSTSLKATFEPVLLLHLYPRSSIDIYIQVLQVDGSLLQASINATTLALISAGLPLSDYVCSLSLASYPSISPSAPPQVPPFSLTSPAVPHSNADDGNIGSGSTTLLDLTSAEEMALPNLTVAVLPRSGKVSLVSLETRVGVGRFEEMLRWGVEGGKVVQGAMEEAVRVWAKSLAAPSKNLGSLFPGMFGEKKEDEMEE
ncbi:exosome complex component RRP41 [Pseudohyphozyma bogoriensis]|nr:exosome complex component RRP41 [Pseudohyphozyma bogoriensis]